MKNKEIDLNKFELVIVISALFVLVYGVISSFCFILYGILGILLSQIIMLFIGVILIGYNRK